jgi:WD40 repeat protein
VKLLALLVLLADSSGRREPLDPVRCGFVSAFGAGDDFVFTVSVSGPAGLAVAGRRDGKVRVWDPRGWKAARDFEAHSGYCYAAVFSPDGRRLATCGLDGAVKLWNPETWGLERTLREKGDAVVTLAFASGGRRLLAGGPDGAWSWTLGEEGGAVLAGHPEGVSAVAAHGDRALTAGPDGSIKLWDLSTSKEIRSFPPLKAGALAAAFHSNGRTAAVGGADGTVRLWNVESGEAPLVLEGHEGPVRALAFSAGGRFLAVGGNGGVRLWDAAVGRPIRTLDLGGVAACGLSLGAGGKELVVTGADNRITTWGESTGASLPQGEERVGGFLGVSYVDGGGAYVRAVLGGTQAERTGFQADDVITGVDELKVEKSDDFLNFMRRAKEGDEINVRVRRGEAVKVVRVKLGRWEEK